MLLREGDASGHGADKHNAILHQHVSMWKIPWQVMCLLSAILDITAASGCHANLRIMPGTGQGLFHSVGGGGHHASSED